MQKLKPLNIFLFMLLAFSVSTLFYIKYQVQQNINMLRNLESKIVREKEVVHILKAELAYLQSPHTIAKYASESLNLYEIQNDQVVVVELDGE